MKYNLTNNQGQNIPLNSIFSHQTIKGILGKDAKNVHKSLDTLRAFKELYPNEDVVLDVIYRSRLAKTSDKCPGCNSPASVYYRRVPGKLAYRCRKCQHRLYPLKGTPLERSRLDLRDILELIYRMLSSGGHNLTAAEVHINFGWTADTAWGILHRIRRWMAICNQSKQFLPGEEIEMDEVHIITQVPEGQIGEKRKRGTGSQRLTHVFTLVGRQSGVSKAYEYLETTTDTALEVLMLAGVSYTNYIMTDESKIYESLSRRGYNHATCNHKQKRWVVTTEEGRKAHTNSCEGLHHLMKGSYYNVHRGISRRWVQNYIEETAFKYTTRIQPISTTLDSLFNSLSPLF